MTSLTDFPRWAYQSKGGQHHGEYLHCITRNVLILLIPADAQQLLLTLSKKLISIRWWSEILIVWLLSRWWVLGKNWWRKQLWAQQRMKFQSNLLLCFKILRPTRLQKRLSHVQFKLRQEIEKHVFVVCSSSLRKGLCLFFRTLQLPFPSAKCDETKDDANVEEMRHDEIP